MERGKKTLYRSFEERHALRNVFERNASWEGLGKRMCFEILELSTLCVSFEDGRRIQ
jgi:hypothetical protein